MCGIGAIEGSRIQVCIPVLFTLDTDNIYIYILYKPILKIFWQMPSSVSLRSEDAMDIF